MKPWVVCAVLLVGCGSEPSYKVGGQTLTVKDSGYVTADFYCQAAAAGQLKLVLVDYSPICGPNIGIDADGGARNVELEHNELELVFVTSAHTDTTKPYAVSAADCTNGPAGPGIATFRHFSANSAIPVETQAVGGQMFLTYVDPQGKKPAEGSFALDFGAQGTISGNFKTFTCN